MVAKTKQAAEAVTEELSQGTALATQNTGSNVVAFPGGGDLDFAADAGVGGEGIGREDLSLPFFSILQDLSPQTKKTKAEYVEGAKPAMFYNSVTKKLYDGEKGVIFIPALYTKTFIEWVPNQGGFVKDHGPHEGAKLLATATRNEESRTMRLPNGNDLIETAYHFGLVANGEWQGDEFVCDGTATEVLMTLKSSGLKVSRRWNTLSMGVKLTHPVTKQPFTPALAYCAFLLRSKEVSNDEGTWYQLDVEGYKPTVHLETGKSFYQQAVAFAKLMADKPLPVVAEAMSEQEATADDVERAF